MLFSMISEEEQGDSRVRLRFCRRCETVNDALAQRCKQCEANLPAPILAYPNGATIRGKYQIEKLLGIGGMGIVYQAKHLLLQKPVALKCIHSHIVSEEGVLARFQREAIAASSLEHPNAMRVIDLDITRDNTPILVTELLVGRDLERFLQSGEKLSNERIIRLLSQALDALDAAHQKGILHRDIKPQNLFLIEQNQQETIKLVDFGLAKLLEKDKDAPPLTQGGIAMGTPAYMSPEQVRGEALDARADLWSIGVVLYQMMTHRLPFISESAMSTALAVLKDEIVVFTPQDEMQRELWLLCKRALSKDKEKRPESAKAFRDELQQILMRSSRPEDTPEPAVELTPTKRSNPLPLVVAAAVMLIASFFLFWRLPAPSQQTQHEDQLPRAPGLLSAKSPESNPIAPAATEPSSSPIKTPTTIVVQNTTTTPIKAASKPTTTEKTPKETPGNKLTVPEGQSKFTYAKSLVLSGKFKDGAQLLEEVVKSEPNNASAHRWLGDAYRGLGRKPQAIAQWKEFLRLSPTHPDAKKVQSQIDSL